VGSCVRESKHSKLIIIVDFWYESTAYQVADGISLQCYSVLIYVRWHLFLRTCFLKSTVTCINTRIIQGSCKSSCKYLRAENLTC
jgi:hypothetical protein